MTGIISFMINTFLEGGPTKDSIGNVAYMGDKSYSYKQCLSVKEPCYKQGYQYGIAITLVVFVMVSVPIMLCVIPIWFRGKASKTYDALVELDENRNDGYGYAINTERDDDKRDFQSNMIALEEDSRRKRNLNDLDK